MYTDRRNWLKQTAFLLAAVGAKPELFASPNDLHHPGDNMILLNSNENAYGPSPSVRKAILGHYLQSNRYPDDIITALKKKIAAHWSVEEENILLGAGSSEIIGLALASMNQSKKYFLVADPAYSVWQSQAKAMGYNSTKVVLDKDRKYDLQKIESEAKKLSTSFIYICNPNNPTGTFVNPAAIKKMTESVSSNPLIFIDEAYTEYADLPSLAAFALTRPNIIVAKTFSKVYGLAGARVGYAIAHPDTIKRLASLQPWPDANISVVSAAAAIAALDDQDFVKYCKQKTEQAREICYAAFKQLQVEYIPSSANFILFNIDKIKGDLTEQMKAKNIYVQHREHFGGRWCRVTMGTLEEMEEFVKRLKEIAG
jgi:histidinol-phosphate aminotransferase